MLRARAHAKVNLSLEIVGRRRDGYHELVTVMQQVELADELEFELADDISVRSSDPLLDGPTNLVDRAARLLRNRFQVVRGCRILLEKNIPTAAGLGGGSSDAATTLVSLCTLWSLELTREELIALALELGSDVPFFLCGGTALVTGRGESCHRIRQPDPAWFLLVNPRISTSTAHVFAELVPAEWSSGERSRRLACDMNTTGKSGIGVNGLAGPLFRIAPEAHECFKRVSSLAPGSTFVSGSGPTIGAFFANEDEAHHAESALKDTGYWTVVTRSYGMPDGGMPCQ